jgi:hypothetical protein
VYRCIYVCCCCALVSCLCVRLFTCAQLPSWMRARVCIFVRVSVSELIFHNHHQLGQHCRFVDNLGESAMFTHPHEQSAAPFPPRCGDDCLFPSNMTSYFLRKGSNVDVVHGGLSSLVYNASSASSFEAWIKGTRTAPRGSSGAARAPGATGTNRSANGTNTDPVALSGWFNSRDAHAMPAYTNLVGDPIDPFHAAGFLAI